MAKPYLGAAPHQKNKVIPKTYNQKNFGKKICQYLQESEFS